MSDRSIPSERKIGLVLEPDIDVQAALLEVVADPVDDLAVDFSVPLPQRLVSIFYLSL